MACASATLATRPLGRVRAPRALRARSTPRAAPRAVPRASASSGEMVFEYFQLERETAPGISLVDITPDIRSLLEKTGVKQGQVNIISRHTTTAVTINEAEPRLMDDARLFLRKIAPPDAPYLHNDLHLREAPPDWPGGWEAWAAQEPENCHSHLLSMLLGNSETVPVVDGKLTLGTWQSVMLVELDGSRKRTVGVQIVGRG